MVSVVVRENACAHSWCCLALFLHVSLFASTGQDLRRRHGNCSLQPGHPERLRGDPRPGNPGVGKARRKMAPHSLPQVGVDVRLLPVVFNLPSLLKATSAFRRPLLPFDRTSKSMSSLSLALDAGLRNLLLLMVITAKCKHKWVLLK